MAFVTGFFLTMTISQFHLAFPVRDRGEARSFYIGVKA